MNRKLSINLYVGEHHFPLTVTAEEEEVLRKATKLLNDRLRESAVKYPAFTKDKLMTVSALTVVTELLEQNKITGKDKVEQELEEIRIILEDSMMGN